MPLFGLYRDFMGKATITVGSGSRTLTPAEYARPALVFSGTLTANEAYMFPNSNATYRVENATTGGYTLSVKKGSGGASYILPANEIVEVRV